MAFAAALLDELMGRNRNLTPNDEANVKASWWDHDVCKYYLCGFCPHDLFTNTRADLGYCNKVHDDELRRVYTKSSRYFKMGYEDDFLAYLQTLVGDVDKRISRGHQRLQLNQAANLQGTLQSTAQEKAQMLTERINDLVEQAEKLGCEGKVEEAQGVLKLCDQLRVERQQLQENSANQMQPKEMEVCPVCGAFLVVGDAPQRVEDHLNGKQHVGFARCRSTIEELKKKLSGGDSEREERLQREREEREKEKQKEREREQERETEKKRRREREDEKSSRERGRERDGDRKRSRSRRRSRSRSRRSGSRLKRRSGSRSRRSGSHNRRSKSKRSRSRERHGRRSHSRDDKQRSGRDSKSHRRSRSRHRSRSKGERRKSDSKDGSRRRSGSGHRADGKESRAERGSSHRSRSRERAQRGERTKSREQEENRSSSAHKESEHQEPLADRLAHSDGTGDKRASDTKPHGASELPGIGSHRASEPHNTERACELHGAEMSEEMGVEENGSTVQQSGDSN